jgi:DNA helicase MCM8
LFCSSVKARAKLELREEATEEDARDVVELMKHSLLDTFCDELGALDFQRSQNGSGTSTRNQVSFSLFVYFIYILHILTYEMNFTIFFFEEK